MIFYSNFCGVLVTFKLQKGSEIFGNTDDMQKISINLFIGMFTVHVHLFAQIY